MPDQLKDVTNPVTLASIALIVGFIVRMLRTRAVGDLLNAFPATWVKRIPKDYLPWVAMGLGIVLAFLDAKFNAGKSWEEAAILALTGILAGGTAVGGHETVARLVGANIYKPKGPLEPPADSTDVRPPSPPSGGLQRFALRVAACFMILVVAVTPITGCAALGAALPGIIAAVVDGGFILDAIERFVANFFVGHPDALAQARINEALARCRSALTIALRSAQGAEKLDQQKVDAAFDDFKAAYIELLALTKPFGVRPSGTKLQASPGALEVPEPLALVRGAR